MAKLNQEDLVLNIIVNGNRAKSEIGKVSRELVDNKKNLEAVNAEMKNLERSNQKNSQRYRELEQDADNLNKTITQQKVKLSELNASLKLEDKSLTELSKSYRNIKKLRDSSVPNSENWKRFDNDLKAIRDRMHEVKAGSEETGNVLTRLTNKYSKLTGALIATSAVFVASWSTVKKATDEYAHFDDVLADVMKTTNLTKDGVKELNTELTKIETRTSQEDLLGLGRIAGKLGYTQTDDIVEFVRANNQLIVALNEDLGGNVEETVNKVGKLVDVFKLKDLYSTEEAFLKVGSALNELGMASTANEGSMVEFARRMGGIAPLANISIDKILGLGATLDQLMISEEVSSTALSKLFVKMAAEAGTYSKYAGMKVTDFKNLLEKDFMGAFVKVLEGVKNNSAGINELASTLGDLGEDSGRTIGVLGSLANNVNVLKSSMDLASTSMKDGTSISAEYAIKNETAAAKMEMAQKQVKAFWIELGEKLNPVMLSGTNIWLIFLKVLTTVISFIASNIKVISSLALAITTYYTVVMIATKWEAISIALKVSLRAITLSLSLAYNLMTGNLGRAAAAQRLLNITMSANPIGLIAAAIVGLTALLITFSGKLSAVQKAQDLVNKTNNEAKASTEAERLTIEQLVKTIRDDTKHRSLRLTAINQLRNLMPSVLKDYNDEAIMAGKATLAIENFTKAKLYEAKIKAKQAALDNIVQENEKYNQKQDKGIGYKIGSFVLGEMNMEHMSGRSRDQFEDRITMQNIALKDLMKTGEEYDKFKQNTGLNLDTTPVAPKVTITDPKAGEKAAREANKARIKELEEAKKAFQKQLEAAGLNLRDRNKMTAEELEKLAEIESQYQQKSDEINKKYNHSTQNTTKVADSELTKRAAAERKYRDKLVDKTDPLFLQEKEAYQKRLEEAGLFGKKKEDLTVEQLASLEILESNHFRNISKIDADAIAKQTDKVLKANSTSLTDLRIKHNDQLSAIKTLDQAKEALSDTLNKKELSKITTMDEARKALRHQMSIEEQNLLRAQLEEQLKILQATLESGTMEGVNFADKILSEEEKEVLLAQIRELKEELAKLKGIGDLDPKKDKEKFDILGMSTEDWENLFKNVGSTEEKLLRVYDALNGMTQLWNSYNSMVAAGENKKLQEDEQANNKKKSNLDSRLKSGTISQESYNKQVEKLDKDLEKKKSEVAYKQAKRERNVALMSAIVNTATAVTKALPNIFLSALVGAMGAFQIGTILKTPLPAIEGREDGGYLDVTRSQDGKQFRAKNRPNQRGFVNEPTVIVGENGKEWVASASTVNNPFAAPIISLLDTMQSNGRIDPAVLSNIITSTMPGRANGGYLNNNSSRSSTATPGQTTIVNDSDEEIRKLIANNTAVTNALYQAVKNGVSVSLLGPEGFKAKMAELDRIQNNADL